MYTRIIITIGYVVISLTMTSAGVTIDTWQYWVIMLCSIALPLVAMAED